MPFVGARGDPTTIVVPLDGSVLAETALRPAVAFAARAAAGRVLLITCRPTDGGQAKHYLAGRAERFRAVVDIDIKVVTNGRPADAMLDTTMCLPGSLLCMATHGHGGVRTAVLGSVAEEIICRATSPVLLVGPRCRTALLPGEIGDMVVTSDGSPFSEAIMSPAAAWSRAMDLSPWLVEVVGPDEQVNPPDEPPRNRQIEAGTERLKKLAARVDAGGEDGRIQVLNGADAARSIAVFAGRLPAAVIAMATHGRSGLARTLMGSVSSGVVRQAPCPVLLVRPAHVADSQ
jgi:nucleotide-binding universal stress UspA family protein